jgi:hypothetical protein
MEMFQAAASIPYRKRSCGLQEMRKIDEGGIRFELSPTKAPVVLAQQTRETASSVPNATKRMHLHFL